MLLCVVMMFNAVMGVDGRQQCAFDTSFCVAFVSSVNTTHITALSSWGTSSHILKPPYGANC